MQNLPKIRFLSRTTPPHIITLIVLAGMSAMVMNMFLPSLPSMAAYFEADYGVMTLSVPLFLGLSGILQIFIGPLSDKYGRRRVLLWGIGLFGIATLGCIYAPNAGAFLAFRMTQAVIAVCMVLSRAVVRDMYDQEKSASMIAYVTMGMAIVPMVSPFIGGLLDAYFGWKSNFWAFFVVGIGLFTLVWADLGETVRPSGLTLGQQFSEYPELLRSPRFWGYSLASGFCSGAFFAYLGGGPIVGSVIYSLSPVWVGIYFGAPAVGYFLGNWITGRNAQRYGVNLLIFGGTIAAAFGLCVLLALFHMGYGSAELFFGMMTFVGLGNGMVIPNATAGMLSVRPHLAGTASGLGGAIMVGGGAALSVLPGFLMDIETGAFPLIYIMLATVLASLTSILLVYWRERQVLSDA